MSVQLGAAVLDGDDKQRDQLEAERERCRRALDRDRLADAERERRQHATETAERDALLARLVAERGSLRARFLEAIPELDVTPPLDAGPVVAWAYEFGRQAYALSHDLATATGDRGFMLRYVVADQLLLRGGHAAEVFLAGIRGRPTVVAIPWSGDITRLRELAPRLERLGNGG